MFGEWTENRLVAVGFMRHFRERVILLEPSCYHAAVCVDEWSSVCAVMDADVWVRESIYNSLNEQTLLSVLRYTNKRWRRASLTTAVTRSDWD